MLDNSADIRFLGFAQMAKRKLAMDQVRQLEVRTRMLHGAERAVFVVVGLAVGFVVVATAIPQKRHLEQLERKLEQAQEREQEVLAERESYVIEHRALREDREFLEIHARDRLNYYREGERVLKFRKTE